MDATVLDSADLVDQLLEAIIAQAELDADGVVELLREVGVGFERQDGDAAPIGLTAPILLGLGLAIRLRRWELHNNRLHLDAGLPSADEVFGRVTTERRGSELSRFVNLAYSKTLQIYCQSFIWSADDCDLRADLAIIADEDEDFFDAVAEFLWAQARKDH